MTKNKVQIPEVQITETDVKIAVIKGKIEIVEQIKRDIATPSTDSYLNQILEQLANQLMEIDSELKIQISKEDGEC